MLNSAADSLSTSSGIESTKVRMLCNHICNHICNHEGEDALGDVGRRLGRPLPEEDELADPKMGEQLRLHHVAQLLLRARRSAKKSDGRALPKRRAAASCWMPSVSRRPSWIVSSTADWV